MKKWIFTVLLFLMMISAGVSETYANVSWYKGYYVLFSYSIEEPEDKDIYYLNYYVEYTTPLFHPSYNPSICIEKGSNFYSAVTIDFSDSKEKSEKDEDGNVIYYHEGTAEIPATLADGSDFRNPDKVYLQVFYMNDDGTSDPYQVEGDILEPDPTPEITPDPEPTPEITPDITPEVTPDPEPTPEDTPTPEPTPTNTPIPTPTPTPILELNAFVTSKDAVAQYKTGGCTPVRSTIEFYEVDTSADILTKVNSEEFLSGTGTMRNTMTPGKVYRYKLTYVYQRAGIQYEKFLWSDDLTLVDQELEDYRSNKKITNFRTLMLYVWEEFMSLELPVEGFHISFQTVFIWVMVAIVLIWFIKKYIS